MNKIAFITSTSANDINVWSGTTKNLYNNLKEIATVDNIIISESKLHKFSHKLLRILAFKKINYTKLDNFFIKKELQRNRTVLNDYDFLFFPAQSHLLNFYEPISHQNIIYLSDATVHRMMGYYWKRMTTAEYSLLEEMEKNSIKKSDILIYASNWAAQDAYKHYHADKRKIHVLPFGANLPDRYKKKVNYNNNIKLLLVGVDWKRKGIDIAIQVVKILNKIDKNYNYSLTIIGSNSPNNVQYPNYINIVGKLNKDNPQQLKKLISFYQKSDIFILPTKAECAGIVFCEAAMYGLPSISYNTGGVSTYIKEGTTGILLPEGASALQFAKKIKQMINEKKLLEMSTNSREFYEKKLNWQEWTMNMKKILNL